MNFKSILFFCFIILLSQSSIAQVAINDDGANPDASAILDIKSTDKGMLIPRMTTAQRTAISSPATGLLVFDNETNSFWFYDGSTWGNLTTVSAFEYNTLTNVVSPDTSVINLANADFVFGSNILDNDGKSGHNSRFFFDKSKSAFRAGLQLGSGWDENGIGMYSFGGGRSTLASGDFSYVFGDYAYATGDYSFSFGERTYASGDYAFAFGNNSRASDNYSFAFGKNADASHLYGFSFGNEAIIGGDYSFAFGYQADANANYSFAFGDNSSSHEDYAFAFGNDASANNANSFSFGETTNTAGDFTFVFGNNSNANGNYSFAFGKKTDANDDYSFAFGNEAYAQNINSVAFGAKTEARGDYSYSFGRGGIARSYAETVVGIYSTDYTPTDSMSFITTDRLFVIGNGTADGSRSDALVMLKNGNTTLNGALTLSNGSDNYTFPSDNGTNGQALITDGNGVTTWTTLVDNDNQALSISSDILTLTNGGTVDLSGYLDNTDAQAISISSDILTLTNGGTVDLSGYLDNTDAQTISISNDVLTLTNGGTVDLSGYLDAPFEKNANSNVIKPNSSMVDLANNDFVFGSDTLEHDGNSDHYKRFFFDKSKGAFRAGFVNNSNWNASSIGNFSFAVGENTKASSPSSFAAGYEAEATGVVSLALGYIARAHGIYSLAMGSDATANGDYAVALGSNLIADGDYTIALGADSEAKGSYSMALGLNNKSFSMAETVIGMYATNYTPISSTSFDNSDRLFTIGNGTNAGNRSDALIMLKNGNTTLHGNLGLNGTLTINNAFSLPTTDGSVDQVLATDGSGTLSWTAFTDNDNQTLNLSTNTLTLTNGGTVDLSGYLDNTDAQALSVSSDILTLTNGGTVDLSGYLDNTDAQALSVSSDILTLTNGGTVDLSGYLDNTDTQALSISSDILTLTNGGTVDLSGYLDADNLGNHTATQNIQLDGNWLSNDGDSEGIFIDTDGNVGIGTSSPNSKLEVDGDISLSGELTILDGAQSLKIKTNEASNYIQIDIEGTGHSGDDIYIGDVSSSANEVYMLGNVGIGTNTPGYQLQVGNSGDGTTARANAWNTFSDRRLKRNFQKIENPIEKLNALNGYYYHWTADKKDQSRQLGVIAQEVETVLPEIVKTDNEGIKSVDYSKLTAYLIEVNKAQQAEINQLTVDLEDLKKAQIAKMNKMEAMMKQLQTQIENMNEPEVMVEK